MRGKFKSKKGIIFGTLIKWIIALLVLVLVIWSISVEKNKLFSLIQRISEFLRFR